MIECIFTIDYEVYGNGQGSLRELVLDPAARLQSLFNKWDAKFVNYVEVAEFAKIDAQQSDPAIAGIRDQLREMHQQGFEIALHLHPQWCNARFEAGQWILDYSEYNLCTLPRARIARIVDDALAYLREALQDPTFTPSAFRAGNWLFQPTATAAAVLAERGIRIDSSVFKGGMQRQFGLDYRPAVRHGFYWAFRDDVNVSVPGGPLLEIPIYTQSVPFWKMLTAKRVGLQNKTISAGPTHRRPQRRYLDYARFWHPRKFDFCRMTFSELKAVVESARRLDHEDPTSFKPLVAIGHTKDLEDLETIERFLGYLKEQDIPVTTFAQIGNKCQLAA